jgi:hypothetical protein
LLLSYRNKQQDEEYGPILKNSKTVKLTSLDIDIGVAGIQEAEERSKGIPLTLLEGSALPATGGAEEAKEEQVHVTEYQRLRKGKAPMEVDDEDIGGPSFIRTPAKTFAINFNKTPPANVSAKPATEDNKNNNKKKNKKNNKGGKKNNKSAVVTTAGRGAGGAGKGAGGAGRGGVNGTTTPRINGGFGIGKAAMIAKDIA